MALTDFVRAPSKKSLLALLKKADRLTPRLMDKLFEGVLFKSELKGFEASGGVDHGALSGLTDDDHAQYLRKDGTRALTANWDAGAFEIRAQTLESDVATGTAPLTIASTTLVSNLNADKLDGYDESDFTYTLISGNDAATDVTGAELEELTDGSDTTLHGHDVTGLTNWPTINYSYVSGNDAGTDVSAAELEELTDGSDTSLHIHDGMYYTETEVDNLLALYLPLLAPIATQTGATLTPTGANYTILCDGTSNTVTINLPTAVGITGRIYNIKAINVDNSVTVSPNGTEEIDGSNSDITLSLMESITIQSDGADWWII